MSTSCIILYPLFILLPHYLRQLHFFPRLHHFQSTPPRHPCPYRAGIRNSESALKPPRPRMRPLVLHWASFANNCASRTRIYCHHVCLPTTASDKDLPSPPPNFINFLPSASAAAAFIVSNVRCSWGGTVYSPETAIAAWRIAGS